MDADFEYTSGSESEDSSNSEFDDEPSDDQMVETVQGLNAAIDNLLSKMLIDAQTPNTLTTLPETSGPYFDYSLLNFFQRYRLSLSSARKYVVEIYIRNTILDAIHTQFFDGHHFFGVGSETYHAIVEQFMSALLSNGKPSICPIPTKDLSRHFDR